MRLDVQLAADSIVQELLAEMLVERLVRAKPDDVGKAIYFLIELGPAFRVLRERLQRSRSRRVRLRIQSAIRFMKASSPYMAAM